MDKWREIWNKSDRIDDYILETLIKADGFDSGAGSFTLKNWKTYIQDFYNILSIKSNESVFDIGCGSGAFVYPIYLSGIKVGGIDYSAPLIDLANRVMKNCDFQQIEALKMDFKIKYDFVISHSVFHYFKNLEYAEDVIEKMLLKSTKRIGIFDINDKSKKSEYDKVRMGKMNKHEYAKKYEGLDHLFFEKKWFEEIAKKYGVEIKIFDQKFKGYSNSKLRFNVIMTK